MALPKYYIYRNLHRDTFSIKYRGKILEYLDEIHAYDVEFKVSQKGRQRVLDTKQKNVHAYVVCENYARRSPGVVYDNEIVYNPYLYSEFVDANTGRAVKRVQNVLLKNGKIYY